MSKVSREWRVISSEPASDVDAPIRQVYMWLLTKDNHVVIVSKDGKNWQLPGGKPDADESATQTAIRETLEETHIDTSQYAKDFNFFGEYTIDDLSSTIHPPRYKQVRIWLQLPHNSPDLKLSISGESKGQHPEDAVRFVKTVPAEDILNFIPWLEKADEYKALKRNKILPQSSIH